MAKELQMAKTATFDEAESKRARSAPLHTRTSFGAEATRDFAAAMNTMLADVFALYLKTKKFHWQMSGPHFRDYHLLLDDQGGQLFAMPDTIAERVRKIGGITQHSAGQIAKISRVQDNDADYVDPLDVLAERREDNQTLVTRLREAHGMCEECGAAAKASLIEVWIHAAERRACLLFEASRRDR